MVQTFCPVTFQLPLLFTARVFSEARSEPDSGSEKPWHQISSPGEDRLQEALLLLLVAVGDDDRTAHDQAEHVGGQRDPLARKLLVEDRLLDQRCALAAVLLGPGEPGPARLVHLLLPGAAELELDGIVALGRRARVVVLQPAPNLVPERRLRIRQRQVHVSDST